jgi:hypothetical protein
MPFLMRCCPWGLERSLKGKHFSTKNAHLLNLKVFIKIFQILIQTQIIGSS